MTGPSVTKDANGLVGLVVRPAITQNSPLLNSPPTLTPDTFEFETVPGDSNHVLVYSVLYLLQLN